MNKHAHHHAPELDPVTGHETTGHEWNGIRELNTPFPRIVLWALGLAFAYSVVAWVLLPAWPMGSDYTRGLLGLDQHERAQSKYERLSQDREPWLGRFASGDFAALGEDIDLMAGAMPAAARLFADNCAACHGAGGVGGPGFPSLADRDWLWGGDPAAVAETVRVGINSGHPDTRIAQMPAFGRDGMLRREEIATVAEYVRSLSAGTADAEGPGASVFAGNCAACHGEEGRGGAGIGAPSLADRQWIYGGGREDLMATLRGGRQGVMPSWSDRLSVAEINLLALYVSRLGARDDAGTE